VIKCALPLWLWRAICWAKSVVIFEAVFKDVACIGSGRSCLLIPPPLGLGVAAPRRWMRVFRLCLKVGPWRGSATPICESPILAPQRPCHIEACQLSSLSLLPLRPKVKFSFCSFIWFFVTLPAPETLASSFLWKFKVEISKQGLCFSWQVCNRWEISHWSVLPESC
jgi:hypothetical protein